VEGNGMKNWPKNGTANAECRAWFLPLFGPICYFFKGIIFSLPLLMPVTLFASFFICKPYSLPFLNFITAFPLPF
jgi:hypothetical protein